MIMRIEAAAIVLALAALAGAAQAQPYFGYDGRTYGELPTAPNFGRPAHTAHSVGGRAARDAGGVPRSCLTQPAHALLDRIETAFGPVRVISTCRPGARIAGSGRISRHASGNAIDFDAGASKGAIVKWLIANHQSGGTMTYASMSHIHVDIGQHFVALNSGGSGGGHYARSRYADYDRASYRGRSRGYRGEQRFARGDSYERAAYHRGYAAIYQ